MEEFWDVYDRFRNKTNKTIKRDSQIRLNEGEYHIVVTGIIQNSKNNILITKRNTNKKTYPGLWECTSGSAKRNESSIEAIIREVYEEIGIKLKEMEGQLLGTIQEKDCFRDIWKFKKDSIEKDIEFNDGEVIETKWVSFEEYIDLYKRGQIVPSGNCIIKLMQRKIEEEER